MQYDLVFEGGGAKGSVFVGALQEFEQRGHTARRFVGTSAGAITATLLAAGYKSAEMLEAVGEKLPNGAPRFSSFLDISQSFEPEEIEGSVTLAFLNKVELPGFPGFLDRKLDQVLIQALLKLPPYREVFSFIERGGLYAGDLFLAWIREKLDEGGRNLGSTTLSQFARRTGSDLSVLASDTAAQELLVLNHRTAPDCPVAWAVRMSMSIPFLWQEVKWLPRWGAYRGRDIAGQTVVDGGVLSNFPIHLITSKDPEVVAVMGDTDPDAVPNLGLLIDETLEVPGSGAAADPKGSDKVGGDLMDDAKRLRVVRRVKRLIDTMTRAHDLTAIAAHKTEVCRLPARGYGTTEFDMSDDRLQALIRAGQEAMKDFLDQ